MAKFIQVKQICDDGDIIFNFLNVEQVAWFSIINDKEIEVFMGHTNEQGQELTITLQITADSLKEKLLSVGVLAVVNT